MTKLISLFVMLSMLIVPVAHAAGIGCEEYTAQADKLTKDVSVKNQHDKKDTSQAGHHCCATHASFNHGALIYSYTPSIAVAAVAIVHEGLTSRTVWPLTEPPIHA